jgi:hypothetical protein
MRRNGLATGYMKERLDKDEINFASIGDKNERYSVYL